MAQDMETWAKFSSKLWLNQKFRTFAKEHADEAHRQVGPMNDANGFMMAVGLIVLTVLIGWVFDKLDKWR